MFRTVQTNISQIHMAETIFKSQLLMELNGHHHTRQRKIYTKLFLILEKIEKLKLKDPDSIHNKISIIFAYLYCMQTMFYKKLYFTLSHVWRIWFTMDTTTKNKHQTIFEIIFHLFRISKSFCHSML